MSIEEMDDIASDPSVKVPPATDWSPAIRLYEAYMNCGPGESDWDDLTGVVQMRWRRVVDAATRL